ncbi:RING-H2 finger protein ATL78-like [Lycium ferocissimum]|uniref:RING-H2 finger protein ATL78-like n=1 Tax=Lycium ferocissimum TaxID=112874 RepID=UPI0028160428|nr:RING-H2 finger protein ATL78-like [Lycium ferocissimum]
MATTSTQFIQEFMKNFHYSRRLLQQYHPESTMVPPSAPGISHLINTFDANVIMVLSVLICSLICLLVLNSIIKCAFRCSTLILTDSKLANTGINKKAFKTFPVVTYTTELKNPGLDSECVICLAEFRDGEKIKVLPKCNHGFHVKCIDKWLNSHSSCPTCRHCLIETCQKIVKNDNSVTTTAISSAPVQEIIEPLQREGVVSSDHS